MNALAHLKQLPETQTEIRNFAEMAVNELQIRDALPLLARLTAMEKLAKTMKDMIKEQLMDEASLYAGEGKSFEIDGVRYTKTERKTYHYNHCEKWRSLNDEIETLQKMMQAGKEFADPDTSEIIQPATVSYSESISVTLKK